MYNAFIFPALERTILIGTREQIANADVLIPKNLYVAFILDTFSLFIFSSLFFESIASTDAHMRSLAAIYYQLFSV